MTPQLHYFPLRGRGDVIRIALSYAKVEWEEVAVNRDEMKANRDLYPFGQCPRYVDGDMDLVQSNTILRYIATKHGLMGNSEKDHWAVDMVLEGVESLRSKYLVLIYQNQLAEDAKATYFTTHLDKTTSEVKNGGAHAVFFSKLLSKSSTGWIAGTAGPSMADLAVYDILDLHLRIFKDEMARDYPDLVAFHDKVAGLPGVKDFLASDKLFEKVNANGLG